MSSRPATLGLTLLVPAMALAIASSVRSPAAQLPSGGTPDPAASSAFYTGRVQPILQVNCYRCHAGLNHRGGLSMDTSAGLMKGGHDGAVLVPGHPEQSLLVKLIRHEGPPDDPMPMPPKGKLSDADIATIEQWVRAGAVMPPDPPTN